MWQFLHHLFMPQCVSQTCVLLQSPYRLHVEFVGLRPLAESMRLDLISLVTVCGGLPICDLGDGEAAAKPVLDAVPVDDGHLCHVVSPFVNPAFPRGHHVRVGAERNSLPNLKR